MKRSKIDVALGRSLVIGQVWRHRYECNLWRVKQVHRMDCQVELACEDDHRRLTVTFTELRLDWVWHAPQEYVA